jgi:molybdenum cofactor biosynthesis enzyme MoaA
MKIHRWLDFKVTRRCNNARRKCGYCQVPVDGPEAAEVLSKELIWRTLVDASKLGFDRFWFLGGEPSIREDTHELFDPLAEDTNVTLTAVTNGRQANWKMVKALYATRALRACLQVSLDGMEQRNLKHSQPDEVMDLILDAARLGQRYSTPGHACAVEVHAVISRVNMETFDSFVRLMARKRIPVSLAMVCPWTLAERPRRFDQFTAEEALGIAHRIDALDTGLPIDAFNPLVASFIRQLVQRRDQVRHRCGAGLTHLVINGDGQVHRCMAESFEPGTALGSIREERFHSILQRVTAPSACPARPECFDGFAWDRLALEPS